MSILHYTIGLPPARNGGSIQYAHDLMSEQLRHGYEVYALTCGDTLFRGNKGRVKKQGNIGDLEVYNLTNPLTPTLIYGVKEPTAQYRSVNIDYENILRFITDKKIKIIHLHTLMGLHKDIVRYIKSLGVKIIYTTHDFHGICLHCNLINEKGQLCTHANSVSCTRCNIVEPSDFFLRLANSSFYHFLKRINLFSILSKPKGYSNTFTVGSVTSTKPKEREYKILLDYYKDYFTLIDKFHFNSTQTKQVFQSFLPGIEGRVISVITEGITDNRNPIQLSNMIKFGFIGSLNAYKGFPILKEVILELFTEGYNNFKLLIYSGNLTGSDPDCYLIEYCPPYKYEEISSVLHNIDCLIVPSKWYETFSLVTLEALAHGRPVIVSDHVGAKDIVKSYDPDFIFSSKLQLKKILKEILDRPDILKNINRKIMDMPWPYSLSQHTQDILNYYNE